jgi:hypothetical protein
VLISKGYYRANAPSPKDRQNDLLYGDSMEIYADNMAELAGQWPEIDEASVGDDRTNDDTAMRATERTGIDTNLAIDLDETADEPERKFL